jgi:hypothetical protein
MGVVLTTTGGDRAITTVRKPADPLGRRLLPSFPGARASLARGRGILVAVSFVGAFALIECAADAKPAIDPGFDNTHQSQSRLMKIPKVRRVVRPRRKSHAAARPAIWVNAPACTEPSSPPESASLDPTGLNDPEIEELEIEAVLPDLLADDSSKRTAVKVPPVIILRAPPPPEVEEQPAPIEDIDRPLSAKLLRARMLPKLCDSGDDATIR